MFFFFYSLAIFFLVREGVGKVFTFDVSFAFTFCVSRVFKREGPVASDGVSFLKRVEEDL